MKTLNLLTLFSGIGSPEMGASRVYDKVNLIAACEWDKFARQSFNANYEINLKHFHEDISDMDGKPYRDLVDILFGGPPCQDYSLAGLRAGVYGKKGILIYEYFRIVDEIQPPIFVYENVKGMKSDRGGKTLKEFLEAFRSIGYHCHYEVLNTKDYGVPQNRERIFLVGFKDSEHYHNFSFAPKIKLEKRLKDILEDVVDEKYYLSDKMIKGFTNHKEKHEAKGTGFIWQPKDGEDIANCLRANAALCPTDNTIKINIVGHSGTGGQRGDVLGVDGLSSCLSATDYKQPKQIKEPNCTPIGLLDIKGSESIRRVYPTDGLSPTLTTMEGGNRQPKIQIKSATKIGYETALARDSINLTHPDSKTRRGRVGKQVAQTLDCACNQSTLLEDYRIRKLTPRECFRLQDFPDTFKQVVSNSQAYKQAGNSISVNMSEMIFRQIELSRYGNTNQNSLF